MLLVDTLEVMEVSKVMVATVTKAMAMVAMETMAVVTIMVMDRITAVAMAVMITVAITTKEVEATEELQLEVMVISILSNNVVRRLMATLF